MCWHFAIKIWNETHSYKLVISSPIYYIKHIPSYYPVQQCVCVSLFLTRTLVPHYLVVYGNQSGKVALTVTKSRLN